MKVFTSHNDEITKMSDTVACLDALDGLLRSGGVLNDEIGHFSLTFTKYKFDTSLFAKKPGEYTGLVLSVMDEKTNVEHVDSPCPQW